MICHTLRGPLPALLLNSPRENEGQDSCTELRALPASKTVVWTIELGSNFSCSNTLTPHPKIRSHLEQDCLELWSRDYTHAIVALGALSSSVQLGINDFSRQFSTALTVSISAPQQSLCLPAARGSTLQQRDPVGLAARLDRCVHPAGMWWGRNWGRDWHGKSLSSSLTQHPLKSSKTRTSVQRLSACIVTGFWKVDGWLRPVNYWDSGNVSKIASPPTNRSSALYLKGKWPVCWAFLLLLLAASTQSSENRSVNSSGGKGIIDDVLDRGTLLIIRLG